MTQENITYKELHEAFMKNHNGTTMLENFILISSGPMFVFFSCCINYLLTIHYFSNQITNILIFFLEFLLIIFTLVLNFTVFSNYSFVFLTVIFTLYTCVVISLLPQVNDAKFSCAKLSNYKNKPFITYFRAIVNIITAICILAVDFNVFPRRLAKTENYGFGLMDTGVGFYIVTNGIVTNYKPNITGRTYTIYKTFLSIIPLLLLGAVRFFTVSALDYQTHTSEYGVHWNFFFTLAFVKLLSSILLLYFDRTLIFLTLSTLFAHQYLLSNGLQQWAMNPVPRNNFFTANREGIISLPGYLGLYFASLILGKTLKDVQTAEDRLKYLVIFIVLLVTLVCLTLLSQQQIPSSRQYANITYIFWMLSMSIYIIVICFIIELSLHLFYFVMKSKIHNYIPRILEAINYNGLTFFLIANLFTGFVNLSFQTMYLDNVTGIIIIACYMLATCSVTSIMHHFKIKLKWW